MKSLNVTFQMNATKSYFAVNVYSTAQHVTIETKILGSKSSCGQFVYQFSLFSSTMLC